MNHKLIRPSVERVNEEDLEFVRLGTYEGDFFNYQGAPFTGFAVLDHHENGKISYEQEYVDGEQMGWQVMYYENGQVSSKILLYGATDVVHYEYDEQGNETSVIFTAPKSYYNKCAELTGMEMIDETEED